MCHIVNFTGVYPDPDKIRAVKDFPLPCSCNNIRSFLGLCSSFHRFVQGVADLARPLADLVQRRCPFAAGPVWGPDQQQSFSALISKLTTTSILAHLDAAATTEVCTDTSGHGIGTVLSYSPVSSSNLTTFSIHATWFQKTFFWAKHNLYLSLMIYFALWMLMLF